MEGLGIDRFEVRFVEAGDGEVEFEVEGGDPGGVAVEEGEGEGLVVLVVEFGEGGAWVERESEGVGGR